MTSHCCHVNFFCLVLLTYLYLLNTIFFYLISQKRIVLSLKLAAWCYCLMLAFTFCKLIMFGWHLHVVAFFRGNRNHNFELLFRASLPKEATSFHPASLKVNENRKTMIYYENREMTWTELRPILSAYKHNIHKAYQFVCYVIKCRMWVRVSKHYILKNLEAVMQRRYFIILFFNNILKKYL